VAAAVPLAVWLHGEHVATLEARRDELSLAYTEIARRRWPLNTPLVSLALPLSLRPHRHRRVFPFFDGLLPEGEVRRMVAFDLGLRDTDTFGLLGALGRDCAGALVIQPLTEPPPRHARLDDARPVDDGEVARRIEQLRVAPLGVDDLVRLSLPGLQHKLLLTRLANGGWALPAGGVPSTHLLKPPIPGLDRSVENEAFCMRLARRVGLRAANCEVAVIGGRRVLVVERFDRATSSGEVSRVHQEDMCQALSVPTERKYEERGGPSLREVAGVLRRWRAPGDDVVELLRACVFTITLGDADRHGKNVSVLHDREGSIRLAPLYDVMSTRGYPHVSSVPGMFVNSRRSVDEVRPEDFVAEAVSWGLSEATAWQAVRSVAQVLPDAIDAEAVASPWSPPELVELLGARARALRERVAGAVVTFAVSATGNGPRSAGGDVWVEPYRRGDGTEVKGHWRAEPNAGPAHAGGLDDAAHGGRRPPPRAALKGREDSSS